MENEDYKEIGKLLRSIEILTKSTDRLEARVQDLEKQISSKTSLFVGGFFVISIIASVIAFLVDFLKK